ncbi:hypothetical protein ACJJTC_009076 [Scirpophaga incertulas]
MRARVFFKHKTPPPPVPRRLLQRKDMAAQRSEQQIQRWLEEVDESDTFSARQLLGIEDYPSEQSMPVRVGRGRCFFCSRARDRTTRKVCNKCKRRICPDHETSFCPDCAQSD